MILRQLTFSSLAVNVYELDSYKLVGEGRIHGGRKTFPGRELTPTSLDIDFEYRGKNVSDTTWLNFYQACSHKFQGVKRPGLDLIFEIKMNIRVSLQSIAANEALMIVAGHDRNKGNRDHLVWHRMSD